jgi:hypothetical protein
LNRLVGLVGVPADDQKLGTAVPRLTDFIGEVSRMSFTSCRGLP